MKTITLTNSELVYLFADKLVSQRSRLVNYDRHHCGEKISIKPLAQAMVTAAVAQLVDQKYISLELREVKKLIFLSGKEVFANRDKNGERELSGIEQRLIKNIDQDTKLRDAVYNLLNQDTTSPWGQIVKFSKDSLVGKGWLVPAEEKKMFVGQMKYAFDPKKREELIGEFENLKKRFDRFSFDKRMHETIVGAINKGMSARVEREDGAGDLDG